MKKTKTNTKTKKKTTKKQARIKNYIGSLSIATSETIQSLGQAWRLEAHQDAAHRAHHHLIWQRLTIGSAALLGALILFIGGIFAFAGGSLAPIYLGAVQIEATESAESIAPKLEEQTKKYKFTLQYPDKTQKSFFISDAGMTLDKQKSVQQAKATLKKSFIERLKWWQPIHLPIAVKKDAVKHKQFIDSYATVTNTVPQDAQIAVNSGNIVITPEVVGEGFSASTLSHEVEMMNTKPVALVSSKLRPSIYSRDVKSAEAKLESLLGQSVVLTIAGDKFTVSRASIGGWIDIEPVPTEKTVDVTVNSGRVLEYINSVSEDYVTPVSNRTVINTASGEVVVDPGSDGSDVVNKDEIASRITDKLSKNEAVSEELQVKYVKAKTTALPAHSKWILANVTTKRMYAYEGSTLVRSFLISAGAPDTPTVLGRYKVYAKRLSQDMRGFNTDGSRYFQPDVPYVLYFYGSYAIHGNYWRSSSWFGNVNSSHGCLGVTVGDGAWIYDWAPIGTPVITQN